MFRILAIVAALMFFDATYFHGRMFVRPAAQALIYGGDVLHNAAYRAGI